MAEFASNGKANAALTTGIIGTSLALLGGAGGLFGGMRNGCGGSPAVSQYELNMSSDLSAKDAKIALLESTIYSDQKTLALYENINSRLRGIEDRLCSQAVVNAQVTANISCIQQNLAVLNGLTKTVIPIDSICPTPAVATTTT